MWRYKAYWPTLHGKPGRATFSVGLYGKAEAKRLAIKARREGLAAFLGRADHAIRDQGFRIRDSGSGIRDQGLGIRD
jgi:hypothetical protein